MRPIDADALIDRMYHDAFETDTDMQKWDSGCWIRYKMFENAIDDAPTIEPKRGEWLVVQQTRNETLYQCSRCGVSSYNRFPFCFSCGADMREREVE